MIEVVRYWSFQDLLDEHRSLPVIKIDCVSSLDYCGSKKCAKWFISHLSLKNLKSKHFLQSNTVDLNPREN